MISPLRNLTFLLLFLCLLICGRADAQTPPPPPSPFSVESAVQYALANTPQAKAAEARARVASEQFSGAWAQPSPTISLAKPYGSRLTGGFDEDVIIAQPIELSPKIRSRTQAAGGARSAAILEAAAARLDITLAVQTAYYEALRADAQAAQARESLNLSQKFADAAEAQFKAGDVPRSNVTRIQIELSRARQAVNAAQANRANQYATLKSLTGLPATATVTLTDSLDYAPKAYALEEMVSQGLAQRPEIRAALALREARIGDIRVAKAQGVPDLLIEGRRAALDRAKSGESIRLSVTFPIFDYGRIRAEVRGAAAAAAEQDALLQEAQRVARLDIETAFWERERARMAVESFQGTGDAGTGRLVNAKEILDMVTLGYSQGANSYLEVIDAQRTYQSEQADYIQALADFRIATARLQRAIGGKLP